MTRPKKPQTGAERISAERRRQIEKEGWSLAHDADEHQDGELVRAALCYAADPGYVPNGLVYVRQATSDATIVLTDPWPWDPEWDKRRTKSREERLVVAGALIAAELDRLDREARRSCRGMGGRAKGKPCCGLVGQFKPWQREGAFDPRLKCAKGCACHD